MGREWGVSGERGQARRGCAGACVACGWAHEARGARPAGQQGHAAIAHKLGQLGARAPGLVFNLVFRLGIFPESPNEHCSL